MAGKYIEFVNPGYSTLYTRDLKYAPATGRDGGSGTDAEAAALNVFDPDSAAPLLEGEFLEVAAGNKVTRGGTGACTPGDSTEMNIGEAPAYLHFHERGRYDAQITKKAHLVVGPSGFEFVTSLCYCTDGDEGEPVFVCDVVSPLDATKTVRGLITKATLVAGTGGVAAKTVMYQVGYCTRVISGNALASHGKMQVFYAPGSHTIVDAIS